MHDRAIERIEKNRATQDPSLNLGNCGHQEFPIQILEHAWFEDLSFGGKHCTKAFAEWADSPHDGPPNKIGRIPDLGTLSKLKRLSVAGSQESAISPLRSLAGLKNLKSLEALDFSRTQAGSLAPLAALPLQWIAFAQTEIADLGPLSEPHGLEYLDISPTRVTNLGPLTNLSGLVSLKFKGQSIQLGKFADFLPPETILPMNKVFISYSSQDRLFVEELRSHLCVLERNNLISSWHDRPIAAGAEWDHKIRRELQDADVILLLLSPDFLNSDYIWDIELDFALRKHEQRSAIVVPILLRSCLWEDTPLSRLQMANRVPVKGGPIDLAPNRDQTWRAVVERVKTAIRPSQPTPPKATEGG